MHGDGIRPDITTSNPPARLLEMTRVLALHGRRPTGVDRVCLAYVRAFLEDEAPCFGLVRTGLGYVLLDEDGMWACLAYLDGEKPWPAPDLISRVWHKRTSPNKVPGTVARQAALARARPRFLGRMLRRRLPPGTVYVNVDQTTLTERVMRAMKSVPNGKVTVFLHDTIPLDFPQYQTAKSVEKLSAIMRRCARHADLILTNTHVSASDIARHLKALGATPPIEVAHLGVERDFFEIEDNRAEDDVATPYFIAIGTIEPRKNIKFLLQLWDRLADGTPSEDMPRLLICGRRGWESEDVLMALDEASTRSDFIQEFNDLSDSELQSHLKGATALLFPSLAEGYGLPPVEAAAMGIPVVANDLPVLREILGDYPIYASVSDVYLWETIVKSLALGQAQRSSADEKVETQLLLPTWDAHFNAVLRVT